MKMFSIKFNSYSNSLLVEFYSLVIVILLTILINPKISATSLADQQTVPSIYLLSSSPSAMSLNLMEVYQSHKQNQIYEKLQTSRRPSRTKKVTAKLANSSSNKIPRRTRLTTNSIRQRTTKNIDYLYTNTEFKDKNESSILPTLTKSSPSMSKSSIIANEKFINDNNQPVVTNLFSSYENYHRYESSSINNQSNDIVGSHFVGIDYIGYNNHQINATLDETSVFTSVSPNSIIDLEGHANHYWALILLLFPIFTIFGNSLVVLSVIKEKNLHTVTNYFVVSLAIADLTVATAVMPFAVYYEVFKKEYINLFLVLFLIKIMNY